MNPAFDFLLNVFKTESAAGFNNSAVIGGLDKLEPTWERLAQEHGVDASIVEAVRSRLRDYPRQAPAARADSLRGLWKRIQGAGDLDGLEPAVVVTGAEASAPPTNGGGAPSEEPVGLRAELTVLQGVGPRFAESLARLGLHTLGDMLWSFPRRYDDYSRLKPINRLEFGEDVTIIGTVWETHVRRIKAGAASVTQSVITDGTATIQATWFNQPYLADRLKSNTQIVLSGRVDQYLGRLTLNSPEWEYLDRDHLHTGRIVPIYALTSGITQKWLRQRMHEVVHRYAHRVPDPLPDGLRRSAELAPIGQALKNIHFPDDWDNLAAARHRLAFDEILLLQLGVLRHRRDWQSNQARPLATSSEWWLTFAAALPYALTNAQQQALEQIRLDMASGRPMNRLLQGDVGSGKTVVAAAAMAIAVASGAQAALMAPTSILAEQHYRTLQQLLGSNTSATPASIRLLLGSTSQSEKAQIRAGLSDGSVHIVVGTHALIEAPVEFALLGLAVVDEQHRFGVAQRAALRAKGVSPHLLVMTATPIPRSLALTLYGDLDLSVLDEMPPGRQPIQTRVLSSKERERAYAFIRIQLEQGRQAFVITPLVEESDNLDAKAAVEEHARLQDVFPDRRVALLHGRMRPDEKEKVMREFRDGEAHVLVATSVVEVGVDVPNASVMMIEGANRFGLAQLHQFRGRVGRGPHASTCLLIADSTDEDAAAQRLQAMERTQDGFELAQLDLEQRGPGEFLGTRQAGLADLRLAKLTDLKLIEKARRHAEALFQADPDLEEPAHHALRERLAAFWSAGKGDVS